MTNELTIYCHGRDRQGNPTHDRTEVAHLRIDAQVGVVMLPTAQQRGDTSAGRPHAIADDLECLLCGDKVRVGRGLKRLRMLVMRLSAAGVSEAPLQALRA